MRPVALHAAGQPISIASVRRVCRAVPLMLVGALIAAGCGDAEPEPASTPEQRLADRVEQFWADVEAGDGDAACAAVTDRGRRMWVRWSGDDPEVDDAETCPDAVAALSEAWAEQDGDGVTGPGGSFSADDVWIDGDEAQVQCRYRGAMMLRQVDGEWLVRIPACYD